MTALLICMIATAALALLLEPRAAHAVGAALIRWAAFAEEWRRLRRIHRRDLVEAWERSWK